MTVAAPGADRAPDDTTAQALADRTVTVLVATEFLAELREWSQPVQVQIIETPGHGTGWELTFRINEADVRAERDAAVAQLADVDDELREAGIEYPLGARGVHDLGSLFEGMVEARDEAEAALAERDATIARVEALARRHWHEANGPVPEWLTDLCRALDGAP